MTTEESGKEGQGSMQQAAAPTRRPRLPKEITEKRTELILNLSKRGLSAPRICDEVRRRLGYECQPHVVYAARGLAARRGSERVPAPKQAAKKALVKKTVTDEPKIEVLAKHPLEDLIEKICLKMREDGNVSQITIKANGAVTIVRCDSFRLHV